MLGGMHLNIQGRQRCDTALWYWQHCGRRQARILRLLTIARAVNSLFPRPSPNEWLSPYAASQLRSRGARTDVNCAIRGTCIPTHLPCAMHHQATFIASFDDRFFSASRGRAPPSRHSRPRLAVQLPCALGSVFLRSRSYSANIRDQSPAFSLDPATPENLWNLHGVLRRLAADRSAWTSRPTWQAVSVQCRKSVFDL
jgi:hypothetical protein